MEPELARWIVWSALAWVAAGTAFGLPFVWRGVNRIDPDAARGSWGFRLLVLPGVIALWPLVFQRWRAATRRVERSPQGGAGPGERA